MPNENTGLEVPTFPRTFSVAFSLNNRHGKARKGKKKGNLLALAFSNSASSFRP